MFDLHTCPPETMRKLSLESDWGFFKEVEIEKKIIFKIGAK